MKTGATYLISVGIAAFGAWVVAGAIAAGSPLAWVLGGLVTVASDLSACSYNAKDQGLKRRAECNLTSIAIVTVLDSESATRHRRAS